jgi:hypothetical protein
MKTYHLIFPPRTGEFNLGIRLTDLLEIARDGLKDLVAIVQRELIAALLRAQLKDGRIDLSRLANVTRSSRSSALTVLSKLAQRLANTGTIYRGPLPMPTAALAVRRTSRFHRRDQSVSSTVAASANTTHIKRIACYMCRTDCYDSCPSCSKQGLGRTPCQKCRQRRDWCHTGRDDLCPPCSEQTRRLTLRRACGFCQGRWLELRQS